MGEDFEFSPILASLEPLRKHMVVVSGLSHAQAEAMGDGNGDHTRGVATWLNGVHPRHTEGADVLAGTTIDQMAALKLGKDTPLPSLELGLDTNLEVGNCENGYSCVYRNNLAWRSPTTPLARGGQSAGGLRAAVRRWGHDVHSGSLRCGRPEAFWIR